MDTETVQGFNIPKRKLTAEEASRPITLERFDEFHQLTGEDFCDQGIGNINLFMLAGYLLAKFPESSVDILEVCNDKYGEPLGLKNVIDDDDMFYKQLANFLNLTINCKARVNQVLIQVAEHYNPEVKTSLEWYNQFRERFPTFVLRDPDGWDRKNYTYSFTEELVTEVEFKNRLLQSTCTHQEKHKLVHDYLISHLI